MSFSLVEVFRDKGDDVTENSQPLDGDLLQLRRLPSRERKVLVSWVDVEKNSRDEISLLNSKMSCFILRISNNVEDTSPQQLLELNIFISSGEERFEVSGISFSHKLRVVSKLIMSGVEHQQV